MFCIQLTLLRNWSSNFFLDFKVEYNILFGRTMAGGSDQIVEYIETCGDFKPFTLEAYNCVKNYVCDGADIKTEVAATEGFDPGNN